MKMNLVIFFFLVLSTVITAQWQPDFRLTNSNGFSINNSITSNDAYVHTVWQDTRDGGNNEIYYKRSTNYGISWENDIRLTNNIGTSQQPSIAVSGTYVYIVWEDNVDGNPEIYFIRSNDNGISWGGNIRLTNNVNVSSSAKISASGSSVQLIWRDVSNGFFEIFHKHSYDWGTTWSNDTILTSHTVGIPGNFSLSTIGSNVHIVWSDSRDGNNEIYYKRSTNSGETWETDTRLTVDGSISEVPSITCSSTSVHIAWLDLRDGNNEIYYKHSTNAGVTWSADTRLTLGPFWSQNPSIVFSGTIVQLVYQFGTSSNLEIFYKRSTDNGVSWEDSTQLSNSLSIARNASISASGASTHVVWTDTRHGSTNHEIYYKRNPSGNVLGVSNQDEKTFEEFDLLQNYPNPFNPSTRIQYQVARNSNASLKVYDLLGNEVVTLVDEYKSAGSYEVDFSIVNIHNGLTLPSGVYFYQLKVGDYIQTKKMIFLR